MILTLDNIIITIYSLSILASVVAACCYRKFMKGRSILILLPFLIYVFIQEIALTIYLRSVPDDQYLEASRDVTAVYNFYKPLCAFVLGWMYAQIPFLKQYKKMIMGLAIAYTIALAISFFFVNVFVSNPYFLLLRNSLITFFATLFLYRYFLIDNLAKQQFWKPELWITIGIVFFYPVSAIAITFHKYLYDYNATLYGLKLYQAIPQLMSIFMYSCFCYAFYLCKKKS